MLSLYIFVSPIQIHVMSVLLILLVNHKVMVM